MDLEVKLLQMTVLVFAKSLTCKNLYYIRDFIISQENGLFSSIGIGGYIPSLKIELESFLPHTTQQSFILVSKFQSTIS